MFQRNKKIITKKCKHSFSLLKHNIELRVSSTTITLENTEGTITMDGSEKLATQYEDKKKSRYSKICHSF